MRAIKIDPENRSIEEIELAVDPNRSIHGVAVILGGSPRRLRTLHENKASFDMIVDWR